MKRCSLGCIVPAPTPIPIPRSLLSGPLFVVEPGIAPIDPLVPCSERVDNLLTALTDSHLEYRFKLLWRLFLCFGFSILTTLMVWSCWAKNSCVPGLMERQQKGWITWG